MSYNTIAASVQDAALRRRVTSSCAQEGADEPELAMQAVIWPLVTATDIEAAYASALAAGNDNPGGDESVITDPMILAKVQAFLPPTP